MGAAAVLNSVRDPCPRGVRSDQPEGAFLPILVITRVIGGSPAIVDPHITTDGPARLLQPLQECPDACLRFRIVRAEVREYANAPHARPLLCARRERPRDRAAECSQQFPPSDGDCHTPLPCEVRKWNDTTSRACSLAVQGGQNAGCCRPASGSKAERLSFPLCLRYCCKSRRGVTVEFKFETIESGR